MKIGYHITFKSLDSAAFSYFLSSNIAKTLLAGTHLLSPQTVWLFHGCLLTLLFFE